MNIINKIYNYIRIKKNIFFKNFKNKLYAKYAKYIIKESDFTIICNNCYAGHLYETLNIHYTTPTVGLFFFADDFVKFVEDLKYYLNLELQFKEKSNFKQANKIREKTKYPIGVLNGDIEIHFLHYHTQTEAKEKWNRRKSRINWDKLFIIMNDQNNFNENALSKFNKIRYPKVFLSSKNRLNKDIVWVKNYRHKEAVGDMYNEKFKCLKYFDIVKWTNQKLTELENKHI